MSEKHFDDGSQEYIDQHSNCLQCRRIESERDALKAELEEAKKIIFDLESGRDLWKSRAAKYREYLETIKKHEEIVGWDPNPLETVWKLAQEALSDDVSRDAARTKEMERGMLG